MYNTGPLKVQRTQIAHALPPCADHAGPVRPGQQSRRPDAAEARRHDGPQQEGDPGQRTPLSVVSRYEKTFQKHIFIFVLWRVLPHDVWLHCVFIGVVSKLQSKT